MTRDGLLSVIALGAVALAWAVPLQSVGCGQNAHYAATRSFAEGRPFIDRYARETCDVVQRNGHTYAAKGPALDFWSAPWYLLLRTVHAVPVNPNAGDAYPAAMAGVPLRAIWQLGLWAVVVPGLVLLLLVRWTVEQIEPGLGTACAVVLGLGTLVLPFSTVLFAHVPAAMLAFASFALLFKGRSPLAAGVCAGLAVATDLPLAVPAVALAAYAASRVVKYAAGVAIGLLPLFAFGIWALGSPFSLAYQGAAIDPGAGGVEQAHVHSLFFTLTSPHPRIAFEMLFSQRGLFVLSPVVGAGVAGIVLLWRRGLRAEAALIGSLCILEAGWMAFRPSYELALGGWVPGPRFLIPLLPFLCFALAPALRRAPLTVGVLALISVGAMTVATAAEPLLQNDNTHHWISRIVDGNFTATVVTLAGGGHGWIAIVPFFLLIAIAIAATFVVTPVTITRADAVLAVTALIGWIVVEHGAPALLQVDRLVGESWGVLAAVCLVAALVWALVRLSNGAAVAAAPAFLLLAFALRRFDAHTKSALLLGVLVLAGLALAGRFRASTIPA